MVQASASIVGYADKIGLASGETIKFMVSCEGVASYRADIVRVICGDANPEGPGVKEKTVRTPANRRYRGRRQVIHAGSYAIVPARGRIDGLKSFTVQAMIWPTTPDKGEQALIGRWTERDKAGFQLMIDENGALARRLGNGKGKAETIACSKPLIEREWAFVGASYDAKTKRVAVCQEPLVRYARGDSFARASRTSRLGSVAAGSGPIVMAAIVTGTDKGRNVTAARYNGKLDSPRLADRALSRAEMAQVQAAAPAHLQSAIAGAWDFSLDIPSQRITDISGNGLHGESVNLPTRGMTGHNWTGAERKWTAAPGQYGAIHFHDDDIYDCGWEPDFEFTVPKSMKSGAYAARLRGGGEEAYISFFVRPPRGAPSAKILYLASTATYMAYANISALDAKAELHVNRLIVLEPWAQFLDVRTEFGRSLYDSHSDGSGIAYSSRLRPILNMRPKVMHPFCGDGSALWSYNADTHITDWLEAMGHDFDVATDEDLHAEGVELLQPYSVVLTGAHPEYTSAPMWDGLKAYTEQGGRLMYLGGNGFYWQIAYHPELPGVLEVRRGEDGTRAWKAAPGEFYDSFTGEYGGLWLHQDRAPQRLAGAGFIAQGFDTSGYFRRTAESTNPRIKWAFEGIGRDERIGDFGLLGGGAAGLEVDIADVALGTPPHALVIAKSEDLSDTYLLVNEQQLMSTPEIFASTNPLIRADLVFYETPNGGAVFAFSSIAWCGSLSHAKYRNNVSRLTGNVLKRFISSKPL